MFTFRSQENARYVYYANVIRDWDHVLNGLPSYFWFGDADEDKDGSPDAKFDPTGQSETRWHYNGRAINGNIIPFIVVPPQIIKMVAPVVGGCLATAEYKDKISVGAAGDSGPLSKIGEMSSAMLEDLGLPFTKNGNGGLDTQEILYRIWPGVPARIERKGEIYQFELQPS